MMLTHSQGHELHDTLRPSLEQMSSSGQIQLMHHARGVSSLSSVQQQVV